ncbi:MAG: CRISPR-associated endonuclease Cas2 [Planctomycetes bacterium]|nr:CRISPR-associated endonuclease Cas2 [Planctomycetota bacterium]
MYLVAYDICQPRRLRRVARLMEHRALRCQKSVFLFRGGPEVLVALLDEAAKLLNCSEDRVQAWLLAPGQSGAGLCRGAAFSPEAACVVAAPGTTLRVERTDR